LIPQDGSLAKQGSTAFVNDSGTLGKLPLIVSLALQNNNLSGLIPQDGSLAKQGSTAFVNDSGLCGFPWKNPCKKPRIYT
jgi:hypothetical protein